MNSRANRRGPLAAVLSIASLVLAPSIARAEVERPSQGEASNGVFLSYAPRPDDQGAICFVDSGIDENPDTEDAIIERTSVAGDGSSGEDVDTDERHGTLMAMVAGAPRNGWGMVGTWSQLKLVGVRASNQGDDGFPFERYRTGIQRCRELARDRNLPIKVVLLALGGSSDPSDTARKLLEDTIEQTRRDGINVVAAAGNDGDDRVLFPARVHEVLAVGASERDGDFCDFSNRGEGLDLRAPGCGLDTADPRSGEETRDEGTSHASAIVAATIAALRTYDEDIDVDEAEELVLETTNDDTLDVEAAFRRAGLDQVVEAGEDDVPDRGDDDDKANDDDGRGSNGGGGSGGGGGGGGSGSDGGEPGDAVPLGPAPTAFPALPVPSFAYALRDGVLHLRVRNRPPGARVVVTLFRDGGEFGPRALRRIDLRGTTLRRRVPRFAQVSVGFSAPGKQTSETVRRRTTK